MIKKRKRAAELALLISELAFQNEEKKSAAELIVKEKNLNFI
jgi:hypothetical protein